ncbi:hypothetical protein BH10PLA2_BH10PLA2_09580 [soil metagenome]
MPKFWDLFACLLCLAMLTGCGGSPKLDIQTFNGKKGAGTYLICGNGQAQKPVAANGDIDVALGANHLELKGKRVLANGKGQGHS